MFSKKKKKLYYDGLITDILNKFKECDYDPSDLNYSTQLWMQIDVLIETLKKNTIKASKDLLDNIKTDEKREEMNKIILKNIEDDQDEAIKALRNNKLFNEMILEYLRS